MILELELEVSFAPSFVLGPQNVEENVEFSVCCLETHFAHRACSGHVAVRLDDKLHLGGIHAKIYLGKSTDILGGIVLVFQGVAFRNE